MKTLLFLLFTIPLTHADPITLEGENYQVSDVAQMGFSKEALFKGMDRDFIKLGGSICANRAHMWSYEFKRTYNIDSAKLFLFYTKKTGEGTVKTWWYHVTPLINENSTLYAMDAGFRGIKEPLHVQEWLHYFTGSNNCRAIQNSDTDLIERMFKGRVYPETSEVGTYDCYYRIVPAGYWFPSSVAMHLLGRNASGRPVHFERPEIRKEEVYAACVEAVTSSLGRVFGAGKKKCRKFVGEE